MNMTASDKSNAETRYNIRVLDRAIRLLSLLSDGKSRLPVEISEGIGLSPATTHRILATLSYYNFIKRDERTGQYSLGLACMELARAYQDSNDLRKIALPELEGLRDETKETVHLAILDQMEVIYLEKLSGLHAIGIMTSRVGGRSPAYCTGLGKILLAHQNPDSVREYYEKHGLLPYTNTTITDLESMMSELETVRQQGLAFDHGEHENEVRCVAAPIFDMDEEAVAALSISGPYARLDPIEGNQEIIEKIKRTAMKISQLLGHSASRLMAP